MMQMRRPATTRCRMLLGAILALLAILPVGNVHVASAGPALAVNIAADRHPISPNIYGMNFADPAFAQELHLPVDRWGGNATSRYNWQANVYNTGTDYFFENIAGGETTDQFVDADRAHGTKSIVTVPLMGYVSKPSPTDHPFACGFKVSIYGAQKAVDPYDHDCGNGIRPNGTLVTGNNPLDTSIAIDPAFVQNWVAHFVARYSNAASGGVPFYELDNEPSLWHDSHRDVHPATLTYDELVARAMLYAAAIKSADPTALTLGPSDWGWPAYFDTPTAGDRAAHGNLELGRWYLQQLHAFEQTHGVRLLDYFDEHFYPQANGVSLSPAGNAATQARRLRSTRGLWDPTYVDESWINAPIEVLPLLHRWIDADYPGTKLAITEYNWGGLESINGALAEADVLGIFGRERVDLATLWDPPSAAQPGAYAFRLYRNYDGQGSAFGETSIRATSADQGVLAIYGAERSGDGAVTLMVINKSANPLSSTIALDGFTPGGSAAVYTYSSANLSAIVRQADTPLSTSGLTMTFGANAVTLIVLHAATPVITPPPTTGPPSPRSPDGAQTFPPFIAPPDSRPALPTTTSRPDLPGGRS